jgi:hypothetical protein
MRQCHGSRFDIITGTVVNGPATKALNVYDAQEVEGTGRVLGNTPGIAKAALIFLPLWPVGAGINMYAGVNRAGYSVGDEAPIFLLVFAVPAAAAVTLWWTLRS